MNITDFQPMGPERMLQRMQELQSKMGVAAAPFPNVGLSGQLPDAGFAPFNPTGIGVSLKADEAPANLRPLIQKAAQENGIDMNLLDALVATESSYDPNCRSRAGAMGLTQLMPANVKEYGVTNPFDPEQNLQAGARQLAVLIDKYPGRLDLALAAYNAGPGAVAKAHGIPQYTETQNYVKKVLGLYEQRKNRP